jgi:hypothetical protein
MFFAPHTHMQANTGIEALVLSAVDSASSIRASKEPRKSGSDAWKY